MSTPLTDKVALCCSADMYDVGYRQIVNIDISDVAIKQMTEKNKDARPDMQFVKMDMLEVSWEMGCIL